MYQKLHNGQLSIEDFHVPFGGMLDSDNRWVIFSSLMPWEELEAAYAPQFSPTTGAPAKPVRLAFGALFIKQRLGLTDEETVEQIRENVYMQFFLGFAGYSSKAPFDPSMMVHFRKRFSKEELSRINELIAERGKAMVMDAVAARQDDDDSDDLDAGAGSQLSIDDFVAFVVMCAEKIRRLLRLFFVGIFVWLCAWQWRGCLWIERRNTWQLEMADLPAAV